MHDYHVVWSREAIYDVADIADYIELRFGHTREKHMLSETLDARAFKALGVGNAPFPRQPIGRR